ncbi:MAG: hypothetical protein JJT89_02665 [Nitriliruptoraceae bacterium]|nr:hypothetical protein [Nitriliruptoraceae bacterium]
MTAVAHDGWPAHALHLLLGPPRVAFHLALVPVTVALLWVGTWPGVPFVPLMLVGWLLAFATLVWLCKLVGATVPSLRLRWGGDGAGRRWFLLAPVGGVLVTAVLASGLAFDARWAASEDSFEVAAQAAADGASGGTSTIARVGLYRVFIPPIVIGDAVVFHHPDGGGVFDDAGFAYLPEGLTPEIAGSFESLRVMPIDGDWYRWWSSW